jgi:hypothetical protein
MGTGLPVVLRARPTVNHLVIPEKNGWYVATGDELEQTLGRAVDAVGRLEINERLQVRRTIADFNRMYLSYDVIAAEIVAHGPKRNVRPLEPRIP